jgi:hypothetical protein
MKELKLDSMGLTSLSISNDGWTSQAPMIKSLNLTNNSLTNFSGQSLRMLEYLYLRSNWFFIIENNNLINFTDNILGDLCFLDISTKLLIVGDNIFLDSFSGNVMSGLQSLNISTKLLTAGNLNLSIFSGNELFHLTSLDFSNSSVLEFELNGLDSLILLNFAAANVQIIKNNTAPLLKTLNTSDLTSLLAFDKNNLFSITSLSFSS